MIKTVRSIWTAFKAALGFARQHASAILTVAILAICLSSQAADPTDAAGIVSGITSLLTDVKTLIGGLVMFFLGIWAVYKIRKAR